MYRLDTTGIDDVRSVLGDSVIEKAVRSTVNKVASRSATAVKRAIRDDYAIKARDLTARGKSNRNGIRVRRARVGEHSALLLGFGRELPLINFQVTPRTPEKDLGRKRRRGVRVRVKKPGKKTQLKRVFVAQMDSGHVGLFERKKGSGRLPIRQLFGPSVPSMLGQNVDAVESSVGDNVQRIFSHELNHFSMKALGLR